MRLVYICRKCTLLGGQSRIAWELMREAVADQHETHLVARRMPPVIHGDPIRRHRVFQLPKLAGKGFRFKLFAEMSSRRAERVAGADGVIHGFGDSLRQHILTLGNVDWNYPRHLPGRSLDRTATRIKKQSFLDPNLQILVLESHQMKADLLDLLPEFDQKKLRVIYPGVDVNRFSRHGREDIRAWISREYGVPMDTAWIVFAAGGDFEKRNLATIQKALLGLRHRPDWNFLFVGASRDQVDWPRELQDKTYFLGRLGDIGTVLPGCDFMVYPAWYDEFALVCSEAMASGLPVLASAKVGASEVLSEINKQVGVLPNPGDAADLMRRMVDLISNPSLRRRIGEENRKASLDLSWKAMYHQYRCLYEEILARRKTDPLR
jgi:glycosyltransferase involved in cell wall biosynthesis